MLCAAGIKSVSLLARKMCWGRLTMCDVCRMNVILVRGMNARANDLDTCLCSRMSASVGLTGDTSVLTHLLQLVLQTELQDIR